MAEQQLSSLAPEIEPRYGFIWVGVLMGLGYWMVDIFIDVVVFNAGTLRDQLLHPSASELMMRLSFLVLTSCFGIYAFVVLRREQVARSHARSTESRLDVLLDSAAEYIFFD